MRFLSFGCAANREQDETKRESIHLFRNANKSIKIITGDPNSAFYRDTKVKHVLKDAIKRGVDVEIAYYPRNNKETVAIKRDIPSLKVGDSKRNLYVIWLPLIVNMFGLSVAIPKGR